MTPGPFELRRGDVLVSDDPARLDLEVVHGFLAASYWAAGIPAEVVRRSLAGSLCFGLYRGLYRGLDRRLAQIGFARAITDRATYAYLADVFVVADERGRGLGTLLMEAVMAHPDLQGLRRWSLVTRDAHALYRKLGFTPLAVPERHMERVDLDLYLRAAAAASGAAADTEPPG